MVARYPLPVTRYPLPVTRYTLKNPRANHQRATGNGQRKFRKPLAELFRSFSNDRIPRKHSSGARRMQG